MNFEKYCGQFGFLPEDFGFMLSHKSACCAPTQLEDYKTHQDPPGISGTLAEGRFVYDAYVFEDCPDFRKAFSDIVKQK